MRIHRLPGPYSCSVFACFQIPVLINYPKEVISILSLLQKLPKSGNFGKTLNMGKNTSVSLGDHFENFVEQTIAEGRYSNASEVIRAGLRLLEEEESRFIALKNAVQEGLESGFIPFDPKPHLKSLKAGKQNG